MQSVTLLVAVVVVVLIVVGVVVDGADNKSVPAQPIWDIETSCRIPNEDQLGICQLPEHCAAFQQINDLNSIRNMSRLSFIRQLQCAGDMDEGKICCPQSTGTYRNPWIDTRNMTTRVRKVSMTVANRVGNPDGTCGMSNNQVRISGGSITAIDEFPWMAMLIYDKDDRSSPSCGGALISKTFVLTAAHCLVGAITQKKGSLKFVRLGEYDLNSDPDCVVEGKECDCTEGKVDIKPKRTIVHPEYQPNALSQHHDIGLIQLEQPAKYSDFIDRICLPNPSLEVAPQTKYSVCGWGRTNFFRDGQGSNMPSPIKLKVALPLFDHQKCRDIYQAQMLQLGSGQLCVGGEDEKDSCAGDSGSPLMVYDRKSGSWVLTGLVSIGVKKCGTAGKPGIYTNVKEYVDWIKANVKQ